MKRHDSGQTLIEIILALTVVVVVITGITYAITSSLKNATFTKNQNLASSFAQQGMDIVRGIKDRNWAFFDSLTTPGSHSYFLSENSVDLTGPSNDGCPPPGPACAPNIGGIFSRRVKISKTNPDCDRDGLPGPPTDTKVTVQVKWTDKVCLNNSPFCHQVELVSCFVNVNNVPTP